MNRIDAKFAKLKENGKKALITYLTAGDPDLKRTEEAVYAMERGGADIIEVGIPFQILLQTGLLYKMLHKELLITEFL